MCCPKSSKTKQPLHRWRIFPLSKSHRSPIQIIKFQGEGSGRKEKAIETTGAGLLSAAFPTNRISQLKTSANLPNHGCFNIGYRRVPAKRRTVRGDTSTSSTEVHPYILTFFPHRFHGVQAFRKRLRPSQEWLSGWQHLWSLGYWQGIAGTPSGPTDPNEPSGKSFGSISVSKAHHSSIGKPC